MLTLYQPPQVQGNFHCGQIQLQQPGQLSSYKGRSKYNSKTLTRRGQKLATTKPCQQTSCKKRYKIHKTLGVCVSAHAEKYDQNNRATWLNEKQVQDNLGHKKSSIQLI